MAFWSGWSGVAKVGVHPHPSQRFSYGGDVPEALDRIRKERSHALVLAIIAMVLALFATLSISYLILSSPLPVSGLP
ncbi:MAG TPA: hypothetical protein VNO21_08550 [Polyangiaceae bacterium]|nr:hypothetical protein [Polyangiaceae bacterium]